VIKVLLLPVFAALVVVAGFEAHSDTMMLLLGGIVPAWLT